MKPLFTVFLVVSLALSFLLILGGIWFSNPVIAHNCGWTAFWFLVIALASGVVLGVTKK